MCSVFLGYNANVFVFFLEISAVPDVQASIIRMQFKMSVFSPKKSLTLVQSLQYFTSTFSSLFNSAMYVVSVLLNIYYIIALAVYKVFSQYLVF